MPIDRDRVHKLARQNAGLDALEAFLAAGRPDVPAIAAMEAQLKAIFHRLHDTKDPNAQFAGIDVAVDWFRLHEDDYRRLHPRAVEALRLVEHHRAVVGGRITSRRNRKASARHRALLAELEDTRGALAGFVGSYPRAMAWIREFQPTLFPFLQDAIGCSVIHVSP
jgi:hypothetical protein